MIRHQIRPAGRVRLEESPPCAREEDVVLDGLVPKPPDEFADPVGQPVVVRTSAIPRRRRARLLRGRQASASASSSAPTASSST